ncbi:hypothetical protein, partial [Anaerostipes hadrus]|nr:arginine--tRNA ligase [Anaerostipes hadrus]
KLADEYGRKFVDADEKTRYEFFRQYGLDYEMAKLKKDLEDFRVRFDVWYSETSLYKSGKIDEMLTLMREKGHIYEKDGATWFR